MTVSSPVDDRRERFTAIYEANYHRILGYALRRTSRDNTADVVAETFLVAWRRLDDVPEGDLARLWLYATARRILANHRRAEQRRERLASAAIALADAAAAPALVDVEPNRAAVAFERLSSGERKLLALVAWEELGAAELATVLGCSRGAARIRLHRARRRFAQELARLGKPLKRRGIAGHVTDAGTPAGLLELEDT
ncbi:MAG: RNA polymerase sigma factor [Actinobacteria bacterium]|nr:RNA polymerase sigma factor [Actinomycetota bacterium]